MAMYMYVNVVVPGIVNTLTKSAPLLILIYQIDCHFSVSRI